MLHKLIIDLDYENGWRTIDIEMTNTIENPDIYTIHTEITDGYKTIYNMIEMKERGQAFKYFMAFKSAKNVKDCCGFEINHKQNLITEKNPYISKFEYIKRFLWE